MEDGFTGLEAAVVLIAFVVIAAVFSQIILAAGFSISQNVGTEVIEGVHRGNSGFVLAGSIFAVDTNNDLRWAEHLEIPVQLTPGSRPVDLRTVSIRFRGFYHYEEMYAHDPLFTSSPATPRFSIIRPIRDDQNPILEPGEVVVFMVKPGMSRDLSPGSRFTVEIIAPGVYPLHIPFLFPPAITRYTRVG
ncbi:flagellin [Methanocalculus chunghsingensis]|uniref:flagellin n=1 Tax=Methanocalculus chunghsingensis TaxID=156457 RepID=UPI001B8CF1E9